MQYHESSLFGITSSQISGSLYESELELFHVNCTNVGYYYCVEDSTPPDVNLQKLSEDSQASKIYLFVEGGKILNMSQILKIINHYS